MIEPNDRAKATLGAIKFVPERIWINDDDKVDGNFIDTRKEAESK